MTIPTNKTFLNLLGCSEGDNDHKQTKTKASHESDVS